MKDPNAYLCDRCSEKRKAKRYSYNYREESDPSGHGYVTNCSYVDLCAECFLELSNTNKLPKYIKEVTK